MCKQRRGVQKYHEVVQVVQQVMETRDYSASQEVKLNTQRGVVDLSHLYLYHSSSTQFVYNVLW